MSSINIEINKTQLTRPYQASTWWKRVINVEINETLSSKYLIKNVEINKTLFFQEVQVPNKS